ncbi:ComEC/Rec2 family competence protein [Herbiconiux sp. 11R-BC]|uniref:ComEC/Rec2 family competence protein n=1 Tax=Herbiconiux sp. 11R-BC TaxID=3111637 RepID=UPI003BFB70B4
MPAAVATWAAAGVLTGTRGNAAWACAGAWSVAAVVTVLLLVARRGERGGASERRGTAARRVRERRGGRCRQRLARAGRGALPAVGLVAAAVALVCTSLFALGQLRHPGALEAPGPRGGQGEFVVTGTPKRAPTSSFGFAADSGEQAPAAPGTLSGSAAIGAAAPRTPPEIRVMIEAELVTFDTAGRRSSARAPTLVFATVEDADSLGIGSRFRAQGSLTSLAPGDSREFLFFARGSPDPIAEPPWYLGWADGLRSSFRQSAAGLPGDGAQLLAGLAIGDDSGVSASLRDAMTVSGLTHLTAVSGANCAIVVMGVMQLGGVVGLGRRSRILVSLGVLVLFVVLVTPEPSVLRAANMAAIVLVASALGRPASGIGPLCLSVIVLLALDPWLARSAGFALSVLATGGLLLLTRPLAALGARILPPALATALAVPVAAQLACQPVLFLLAPQITPYTLPANVLAEPAAALVSVFGLLVCLIAAAAPGLASVAAWLPWVPSAWIGAVARFFAGAPFAAVDVPDGVVAAAIAVLLVLLIAVALATARAHPRLALTAGGASALGLLVTAGLLAGGSIARGGAIPPDWQVAACDIGQGDAVLVHSRGEVALVDVGPQPEPLSACLTRLRIERIDLLVLTHYDRDHVGGLDAVLGRVDRALVGPPDGAADRRLVERLRSAGALVADGRRGLSGTLGDYRWDVLWPRTGATLTGNPASVTVLFSGAMRLLFLGDLGEQAQDAVLAANTIGQVDVVKVAHHGSADQSERLYQRIRAVIGLISVGADNRYGHPTERLLGMLGRAGTRAFRTDQEGLIVLSGAALAMSVWTERAKPP